MHTFFEAALWAAILSTGLMAGIYFAFSVFIMAALKILPDDSGVLAMNSINKVILSSAFMPVFFVSSALAVVLVVINHDDALSHWLMLAGGFYLIGMLLCTMVFNVPLNNRLQSVTSQNQQAVWQNYVKQWTRWNHVRTISCMIALMAYVMALRGL